MRILISGAHLTPALAMIDFIKTNHKEHQIYFVGRLYSQEKLIQKSVEKEEVEKRQIKFIPFSASKFVNYSFLAKITTFLAFPRTVAKARKILLEEKIDLFLSFGSYLAVPFAIAAKSLGITVVTHEQTIVMGKANQFIASIADKVAISYPETKQYTKRQDTVLTGNPIRFRLFAKDLKKPNWLPKKIENILLIMGGNQGSFIINDLIKANLEKLLENYSIVHQCGRANKIKNSSKDLEELKQKLPKNLREKYFIKEWIEEEDLFWIYQHAKFAISRSGANAVLELSLAPLPAILIPLPNAYHNEQMANAEMMQRNNGALVLEQKYVSASTLLDSISHLEKNYKEMRSSLAKNQFYQDASAKLYQLLLIAYKEKKRL
ncbi:UDP-N-acetylglucosamine--N-acetylmuramyl-(pentapeptide) pyrophosphoryl-undecaprenol N-acetylglucosamine transferase [Patescibacteria group bacterium]|nr:UDP-N-acetylglucosamine--N-acetylmuramyl-(pentapeptide) pyrophosphoryl-undecaprenol N-acetylglucosamine transferase [Patescibacteria group bacterium]